MISSASCGLFCPDLPVHMQQSAPSELSTCSKAYRPERMQRSGWARQGRRASWTSRQVRRPFFFGVAPGPPTKTGVTVSPGCGLRVDLPWQQSEANPHECSEVALGWLRPVTRQK